MLPLSKNELCIRKHVHRGLPVCMVPCMFACLHSGIHTSEKDKELIISPPYRMYHRMHVNATQNGTELDDPDFINNVQIVLGQHSLTLTEDTDVISHVEKIVIHQDFST